MKHVSINFLNIIQHRNGLIWENYDISTDENTNKSLAM